MKPTLVILAAGMGSRYGGGGLKQIDKMGPGGEAIMEYAIYDAIQAGFGKVVFVIRESFADAFEKQFGHWSRDIELAYAFQEMNPSIEGVDYTHRTKPWGTGHAVLSAKDHVDGPFVAMYADDYCGSHAMSLCSDFLINESGEKKCALLGFALRQTLSPHGSVNRGECIVDDERYLLRTEERLKISQVGDHGEYPLDDDKVGTISLDALVSMGCFCFDASMMEKLEKLFADFVARHGDDEGAEFFVPYALDVLMADEGLSCKVIASHDQWYGVSYQEDKAFVQQGFVKMTKDNIYPSPLFQE